MTRRTLAPLLLAGAAALALTACSQQAGTGPHRTPPSPATAGLGANASADTTDQSGTGTGTGTGTGGGGNGTGGGHGSPSPSPSTNATGPRIVSFTATGAQCPVYPKPDAPYQQPGQVKISWTIANADGVTLAMDGQPYSSYDGSQGSDTISFQCPAPASQSNTHKYTLTIKNTHVTKTVSASAKTNP